VGVDVYGCISDVSRIFAYECASSHQNAVAGALIEAHKAMETIMEPGRRLKEVFHAGMFAIRKAGFESYSRGHLGHSVGLSIAEEPPYISASCEKVLQPGMIFSLETPYYIYGVGAFNFEDMVLITETGHEVLNQLPEVLQVLPK
jgi:Xaa-Pro aminopeptidase